MSYTTFIQTLYTIEKRKLYEIVIWSIRFMDNELRTVQTTVECMN